ncbi:MAG: DUF1592 domain-containing protein [Rhodopirellula sp. JB044]|uniref:DUF1592 domain-containing protein n=1 Tax=Rhodopirellula sp. JB044 TaxID=3342844 RepID=UPI00370B9533
MRSSSVGCGRLSIAVLLACVGSLRSVDANDHEILQRYCMECHSGSDPEGGFHLKMLGDSVNEESREYWQASLEYVSLGEMPPDDDSSVTPSERERIARYLRGVIVAAGEKKSVASSVPTRRLNNREFANSISDALGIEDPGTHFPLGDLLGDTLHEGFDTNGDALGISEYHLEKYIEAVRNTVDAVILTGEKPESERYEVPSEMLKMTSLSQQTRRRESAVRHPDSVDFRDMRVRMYFGNFDRVPETGYYHIQIRATGVDRGYYDSEMTGVYDGDPIRLAVHLGDRERVFDLPDNDMMEIELTEWLAKGTRIELSYPTDGLRNRGNGNFKFQQAIAHDHIKQHDPKLYEEVVAQIRKKGGRRKLGVSHWSHWVDYWRGPRPRVYGAVVEGPFYNSWPPQRQVNLIGASPDVQDAEEVLKRIAERAWKREVRDGELDPFVRLVEQRKAGLGNIEALKEGIVAILVSPSFLLIDPAEGTPSDRFATKLSYFFRSTLPDVVLRQQVAAGELNDFEAVREAVELYIRDAKADEFLDEFPHAWLQLDRINFMAPDPDHYPHYHRKSVSDDMVAEAKAFFRYAVENNLPVPELLTADYSFINADLARVYGVDDVPDDSTLRRYQFTDGRRGGLLGMGAFLTLTADSLGTSPIHRAVYVLENYMGIKPSPPPGDVEIQEPDVRQAKTIKDILAAHIAEETCASCHRSIDPYGYAFENFDPVGAWRDQYVQSTVDAPSEEATKAKKRKQARFELPVDASSTFRNGKSYHDITDFRLLMQSDASQVQFVRCFVKKLLMYANGTEPEDVAEIERILAKSAEHDFRIVDTIAAVVDSPLFRQQ